MYVHLTLIVAFGPRPAPGFFLAELVKDLLQRTWCAAVGLLVSHGISFFVNFLGGREYERTTLDAQTGAPWKRIFLMYAATMVGAWSAMLFNAPVGALIMLAVLKIVVDLHGHLRERPTPADADQAHSQTVSAPGSKATGVLALFGYFLLFCAVLLGAGTGWEMFQAARIKTRWPTVAAQVVDCRIRETISGRDRERLYSLRCGLRYEVGGLEYVEAISTQSTRSPATVAQMRAWVSSRRGGAVQPIHYDPASPHAISFGEFGESIDPPQSDKRLLGAAAFGVVGVILLLIVRRRLRTRPG